MFEESKCGSLVSFPIQSQTLLDHSCMQYACMQCAGDIWPHLHCHASKDVEVGGHCETTVIFERSPCCRPAAYILHEIVIIYLITVLSSKVS